MYLLRFYNVIFVNKRLMITNNKHKINKINEHILLQY